MRQGPECFVMPPNPPPGICLPMASSGRTLQSACRATHDVMENSHRLTYVHLVCRAYRPLKVRFAARRRRRCPLRSDSEYHIYTLGRDHGEEERGAI